MENTGGKGFFMTDIDMDQVMLDLLVHEGFLVKQTTKSGKVWYKRTNKQLPDTKQGGQS